MATYRETLKDIQEVPIGAAVLVTFTARPWPRTGYVQASLNIQDVIVLAMPDAEIDSIEPREEEAWLGVTVPEGDESVPDVDGGCDTLL